MATEDGREVGPSLIFLADLKPTLLNAEGEANVVVLAEVTLEGDDFEDFAPLESRGLSVAGRRISRENSRVE